MKLNRFISIQLCILFVYCLSINLSYGQTTWQPDSSAYKYFCTGFETDRMSYSGLTQISVDNQIFNNHSSSIKWTIPSNSGNVSLKIHTGDENFQDKVVYTICRRNNLAANISIFLIADNGSKFRIGLTTLENNVGFCLPADEWHQLGSYAPLNPIGGAGLSSLQHIKYISFECGNANEEMNLWIDEVKSITPRGPACIVHFNRYRDLADSLLTPFLLQNNITANIDFNFEFAKNEIIENYSAITFQAIGLNRIDSLVNKANWSCTSHGSFYDYVPYLNLQERIRLCSLDSFVNNNLDARWCFSIPKDVITPTTLKEINDLHLYNTIRRQGQGLNQLPIDNPQYLRFFRPTSASASPNLNGTPLTIAEMKSFVDSVSAMKGLIVLDFGTIVTNPSPLYTDVETTMLNDARDLINYTDSLGIPFINFRDLFQTDTTYQYHISANSNFYQLQDTARVTLDVVKNDFIPSGASAILTINRTPQFGQVSISASGDKIDYQPNGCFEYDNFAYAINDGINIDSADVMIQRMKINAEASRTGYCNPNDFNVELHTIGGIGPYSYTWSSGITDSIAVLSGGATYSYTVTDQMGCSLTDSIFLPTRWAPAPAVNNSIQCGPSIPTCTATANGTIKWFDQPTGGTLLQTGGNTYMDSIFQSTTFYVVSDYGNCTSGRVPVTATFQTPFDSIFAINDTIICSGGYSSLSSQTDPEMYYQWYLDSTAIQGADSRRFFPYKQGSYYLQVTRPQDQCISTSNSIYIELFDTIAVQINGALQICAGDSVQLQAQNYDSTYIFQWFKNDTIQIAETQNSIYISEEGDYKVQVANPDGCDGLSAIYQVTFIQDTVAVQVLSSLQFCLGDSALLYAGIYPAGTVYAWYRNDTLLATSTDSLTLFTEGDYRVEVTTPFGCKAYSQVFHATVNCTVGIGSPLVPFYITSIYPNPANQQCTLQFITIRNGDLIIELIDPSGRILRELYQGNRIAGMQNIEFNRGGLNSGIYFLRIRSSEGQCIKKIIFND